MRYARIEAEVAVEFIETDDDIATMFPPWLLWVPAGPEVQERWTFDGSTFAAPVPPPFDLHAAAVAAIQARLDEFAKTRDFDNIFTACSYANSKNPTRRAQALYCIDARDAHWDASEAIEAAVLAGSRPMPTLDEVMAEMPPLEWPA